MPPSKPPPRRPAAKPSGAKPPAEAAKKTARKPEAGGAATPGVATQRGQAKPVAKTAKAAKTAPNASGQKTVAKAGVSPSEGKAVAKMVGAKAAVTSAAPPSEGRGVKKTAIAGAQVAETLAAPVLVPSDGKAATKTAEPGGLMLEEAAMKGAPRLVAAPPDENVAEKTTDAVKVVPRLVVVSAEEGAGATTDGAKAGVPRRAAESSEESGDADNVLPASGEKTEAAHDVRELARALEVDATREEEVPAPRVSAHPHERPPLPVGALDADVLPIAALEPLDGAFTGAPLLLHASPEPIRTSGVLGTTMGRIVPGKSEGGFTFAGQARLFLRAVNRVGETFARAEQGQVTQTLPPTGTQRCSIVLRNTSGRPIHLRLAGVVFSRYLTPQFPANARGEPFNPDEQDALAEDLTGLVDSASGKVPDPEGLFFRGPHAVLASGFLDARVDPRPQDEREAEPLLREDLDLAHLDDVRLGTRGRIEAALTVQPGDAVLVLAARHEKGGTLQALLDFTAVDAKGQLDVGARFRLATVSSPLPLTADELTAISRGEHPMASAGTDAPETSAPAFPPHQGVLEAGSVFVGGRTVRLSAGQRAGDLVMSMPGRHGGVWPDAAPLTPTAREPEPRTPRTHEGARGISYALTYTLENADAEPREVELLLTSPRRHPSEQFFPQAGVLTLAMNVDGERLDARVNQRGEGRVLACFELPPEGRREVRLEWTHAGGTFPPAGLEWRMRAG
ncbi:MULTISPECIES: hypothetical protein [unclassified Myxococcus]|uniref:hypothetical protein n=1 Tax=unclassified Myxococcus TaxID=2648731 RepID=UPI001CC034BF|nr:MULTISPECIES: hypothetical protein [unclassified Myxococcus]MBZ4399691.1 hypothetical protein [Myxococcus sp. AS-1-15]MBZ4409755.1 hypothetical protein [Myxococcus sp. XM-1-1-1]